MYKVVIVDDEPIIAEGLQKIIPWDKYDCKVAGIAHSGKEGLELIERENPDILFTDINMPGMNGLAMIAAVRSQHENMQISILTGYRDFDYAMEAMNLGVNRFLLKPSKMADLEEAMQTMTQTLNKSSAVLTWESAAKADPGTAQTGKKSGGAADAQEVDAQQQTSNANNFIVRRAISYMEEHYREKLQLTDVAEQMYVSHWHLSKLLNGTGKSFSDILNEIRVEKAKELMPDPSLHIADIAEAVGFSDLAHFARVFKKITGMSANEYRKTL